MAKINVKDLFKKLSFFKNNLSLLVPILIAVMALLLFIPTRILGSRLRKTIEAESAQTGRTITNLASQLDEAAKTRQMEPYITAYARDANQIENLMKQTTLRELLSYRLFPDTNEATTLLYEEFGRNFRAGVNAMLESVKAGVPPTVMEITTALQRAPQQGMGMYGGGYSPYGGPAVNRPPSMATSPMGTSPYGGAGVGFSTAMMTDTQRKIFDTICLEKAQAAGVYVSQVDVAGYVYWDDWRFQDRDAAYKDCWYWQMGYWMVEDVFAAIREMNKGASGVVDAPVKRVMTVSFVLGKKGGRTMRRRPGQAYAAKKEGENPTYVTSAKDVITTPCTGRFSDENYDVMQFDVRVIVGAKDTLAFMKQLCTAKPHKFSGWKGDQPAQNYLHNQITILESTTAPVDPESSEHVLHRYGDAPVVDLEVICEYLFNKAAYEEIKPQQVKDDIIAAVESATKGKKR